MKRFTIYFMMMSLAISASAQISFNWNSQYMSEGDNMKELNQVNDTVTLLAGYGTNFMISADKGLNWEHVPIIDPEYDNTDMSIISTGYGFLLSGDQKIIDNPSDGYEIDVYSDGYILTTSDFGASWSHYDITKIDDAATEDPSVNPFAYGCYGRHFYAVEMLEDSTVFLGIQWYYMENVKASRTTYAGTFRSTDGNSWEILTDNNRNPMAIEASDATVYFGGLNHLYKADVSTGAVTDIYAALTTAAADETVFINDFYVVSDNKVYLVTTSNGVYLTEDQGTTFTHLESGAPAGGNDVYAINDDVLMVLGGDGKSMVTRDGGTTWESCWSGTTTFEIGGVLNDTVVALAKDGILKIALSDVLAGNYNWISQVLSPGAGTLNKMYVVDENTAVIVGFTKTALITTDGGTTWDDVDVPYLYVGPDFDFNVVSTKGDISYAVSNRIYTIKYPTNAEETIFGHGLICRSEDYWNTWEVIDPEVFNVGTDPSVNPRLEGCYGMHPTEISIVNDTIVYIYMTYLDTIAGFDNKTTHSHVYRSVDAGASWDAVTEDLGSTYINDIHFFNEDLGYMIGNSTYLKTEDGGDTFTDIFSDLVSVNGGDDNIYLKKMTVLSEDEWYILTTSDGVFVTFDGGATYSKYSVSGGNDIYKHNDSTLVVLGGTSKTLITWDYGDSWTACSAPNTIWASGGALNDSLVCMAKTYLFKIPLTDLDAPSSETEILTFSIPEQTVAATIDSENKTIVIPVPTGTVVTALVPTITISEGATISPGSEVAQDFTNPVTYTVTAEDTKTSSDWVVTIAVGIDDKKVSAISMYPNPAREKLYLSSIDAVDYVDIYSVSGSLMFSVSTPADQAVIDIDTLESGFYFVNFRDEEGVVKTMKFVKE